MIAMRARAPVALVTIAALTAACGDSPSDAERPEVPALPPLASMQVDLALFDEGAQGVAGSGPAALAATRQNFTNAALRVGFINATVVAAMALPVATLAAAASATPELGDDQRYHWVYTVEEGGQTFSADLAGTLDPGSRESVWEMRISTSGGILLLDDFLWYDGRAAFGNTSGRWRLYDPSRPTAQIEVLRLDWTRASEQDATLSFENVAPGAQGNGDRLTYATLGDARTVTFFDQSEGTTLEVGWSAATGAGYLIAPLYNGGEKACWDEGQEDVPCAP